MKRTAGILLYKRDDDVLKVLLVNNGRNWSIPKGVQSRSETPMVTAARELREETSLVPPKRLKPIGKVKKNKEQMFCFIAKHKGGRPRPGKEIVSARFFRLKRALRLVEKYQLPFLNFLRDH